MLALFGVLGRRRRRHFPTFNPLLFNDLIKSSRQFSPFERVFFVRFVLRNTRSCTARRGAARAQPEHANTESCRIRNVFCFGAFEVNE